MGTAGIAARRDSRISNFCDAYWPAFRKIDFLRAIRSYQQRGRRYGK